MLAIVNGVKTDRKLIAVCEWSTFDVLGNRKDGYEVNDVYRQGSIEIPATVIVHNVPRLPGAADAYRTFPDSDSITCEACFVFTIEDSAIKKALGIKCKVEIGGDDRHITIDRERDGYPLASVEVIRYEEVTQG